MYIYIYICHSRNESCMLVHLKQTAPTNQNTRIMIRKRRWQFLVIQSPYLCDHPQPFHDMNNRQSMSGKPSSGGAPLMHARQYLQGAAHQVNTRKLETCCERHILNAHWLSLICFLSFFILLCRLQTPSLDVYPAPTNRNGPTELSMLYLIHWCPSSTHLRRRKTRTGFICLKIPYFPHIEHYRTIFSPFTPPHHAPFSKPPHLDRTKGPSVLKVTFHQSPRQPEEDLKRHIRYLSTISNGWLTMEISIEMDDFGVPLFKETSIWGIEQFLKICFTFQEYRDFDTNAMTIIIIVNHLKCSSFIWMIVTNGPLLSSTPQHRRQVLPQP